MSITGVADLLRTFRKARGLSQQGLAERAGVSVGMLRDLEQQRTRRPRSRSFLALLEALGLSEQLAAEAWVSPRSADHAGGERGTDHAGGEDREAGDGRVRITVLGPVAVHRGSREIRLGSVKQRALLGLLAVAEGTVPVSDLTDLLWGEDQPESPCGAVQTHLSRLRGLLEPGSGPGNGRALIMRYGGGYRIDRERAGTDLDAFRGRMRAAAAAPDPLGTLGLLEDALRYWRGRPLADVDELADHPAVVALLDEHVDAVLGHVELAGALDQRHRCLPVLRRAAGIHPLNERIHGRLAALLASAGRRAEALRVCHLLRCRLASELGVAAGAEIVEIQRRLLTPPPR